jgi:hypothetical protein
MPCRFIVIDRGAPITFECISNLLFHRLPQNASNYRQVLSRVEKTEFQIAVLAVSWRSKEESACLRVL